MRWFNRQGVQAAALILLVFGPYATVNGQRVVRLPNLETEQSYDQSADVAHLSSELRTRWRVARLPEDPTSGTAVKSVTTQSKLQRLLIDWSDALTDDSSFAAVSPASPLQRKLTRFPPDPEFETETVTLASKPQRLPVDPTSGTAAKNVTTQSKLQRLPIDATQSKLQRLLIDWSDALTDDSSFAAVSPASPLQRKLTRFPPDPEFETETVMLASKPQRLPVDPASEGTVSDELNLGDKLVAEVSPDAETYPISFPSTRPYSKCLSPSQ